MKYKVGDRVFIDESSRRNFSEPYKSLSIVTIKEVEGDSFLIEEASDNYYYSYEIDHEKTSELKLNNNIKEANVLDIKREVLAERLVSKNFELDMWYTDDTFSVSIIDDTNKSHTLIDCLDKEYLEELILLLQQSIE